MSVRVKKVKPSELHSTKVGISTVAGNCAMFPII